MASYDWRDHDVALFGRFPSRNDVSGLSAWGRLLDSLMSLEDLMSPEKRRVDVQPFDVFLREIGVRGRGVRTPPRVFVSHQRSDIAFAERIAWQVARTGFEYWLDVHDPTLTGLGRSRLTPRKKAWLVAAIIEMGLLNCSHVVSVQTRRSARSRWIPYEYGRAKHRRISSDQAASWFETGVAPDPNGDYLSLGVCAQTEAELVAWLQAQPGAGSRVIAWSQGPTPPRLPN